MFKDFKKIWYKSLRWQTLAWWHFLDLKVVHKEDEIFCVLEWLCQRHS
jgi:hypothetical protein